MKDYSLNNIVPAGSTENSLASVSWFLPRLLQTILNDNTKSIHQFEFDGTPHKTLPELQKKLLILGGKVVYQYEGVSFYYLWDDGSYLHLTHGETTESIGMYGCTIDPKLFASIQELAKEFISEANNNLVFVIIREHDEFRIRNVGNGSAPLIEQNYDKSVIKDVKYVIENFKKKDPSGRIAILNGEAGTGKTHLIRGMLSELDCVFLIVPPNLLQDLDNPELMPLLLDVKDDYEKPIVMIIEDGDTCLVPRENDNISAITALLNLSDGILGHMLDIKIIISTNAKIKEMDKAIMRPGRLCQQINVRPLDYDRACAVYERLKGKGMLERKDNYTLAEVYAAASAEPKKVASLLDFREIGY